MSQSLETDRAKRIVEALRASVPRAECWSCDCLHGFLVQLELDAPQDISHLTCALKVPHSEMHACLGCNPCPPAEMFVEYLKNRNAGDER